MSYVIAAPEMMTSAAADLATIGSNVAAAYMAAAARTTSVIPAAADEVSTGIAELFSAHAESYQALAGQAAAFNNQFAQHLTAGAGAYASAEAAIAQGLNVTPDFVVSFVASLPPLITSAVTFLPPPQALLFLLALPIEIPGLFLLELLAAYSSAYFQANPLPYGLFSGPL